MTGLHNFLHQFPWRRVLPILCALLVCTALWAEAEQAELADKVIRLHVVANSDSDADQALKLRVRDAVLDERRIPFSPAVRAPRRPLPSSGRI